MYFQGHASPGIYARSYLEGRLTEEQLDNFRREAGSNGLSSYPPMVDAGLVAISDGLDGARSATGNLPSSRDEILRFPRFSEMGDRKVWAFLGDGECDDDLLGHCP